MTYAMNTTATCPAGVISDYLYRPATQETLTAINSTLKYVDSSITAQYVWNRGQVDVIMDLSGWRCKNWIENSNATYYTPTAISTDCYTNSWPSSWPNISDNVVCDILVSQREQKRSRIRQKMIIPVRSRAVDSKIDVREEVAVATLREMVSEAEFRKFLKYGFVLVKGKSGDTYQVFRNQPHTRVWHNGKVVEEICVRIKDSSIPKTDNVIAFKTIIESDESEFRRLGNVYKFNRFRAAA